MIAPAPHRKRAPTEAVTSAKRTLPVSVDPICPSHSQTVAALVVMLLLWSASMGLAQAVDPGLWIANGPVNAVVRDGGTIYIGGQFTQVGPATGGAVAMDAGTGAPRQPYPGVTGHVHAVAPDGNGGWYVGGSFTAVRGQPRNNLAHLDASGNLTAWNPDVRGGAGVFALAVSGGTVYAGGEFFLAGGLPRRFMAALDAASGAARAWNPNPDDHVYALSVLGGTVYVGGEFTNIGGQPRNRVAALDAASGAATAWNPNALGGAVRALTVSGGTVYAGGAFTNVGGLSRSFVAALDAASGAVTAWNPNALGGAVHALAVSGGTVYVGGHFTSIGGKPRNYVAALDAASGAATAWDPNPNGGVLALAVSGGTVYVGGNFTRMGGQPRNCLAALDAASGATTAWIPNPDASVDALAVSESIVYAGGSFRSLGMQPRNHIAALDAASGAATAWNPDADNSVTALVVSGGTVYAGGEFTSIGGQPRYSIAALDAASGAAIAPWYGWTNGFVAALAVSGGTVYAGGEFYSPSHNIAAFDAASGVVIAWYPEATGGDPNAPGAYVNDLAVSGGTVYVGGNFTRIGGQPRNCLAALDAASGSATAWNPSPDGLVFALAMSGEVVYAGGSFTSIGGQPRYSIAALDAASGAALAPWQGYTDGSVFALAASGGTIYAGGNFTRIGGQLRNRIAALDAASGTATIWNPDARPKVDLCYVQALAVGDGVVYAGGYFASIGMQAQQNLAAILPDIPTATLLAHFEATTRADGVELRWSFGDPSRVASVAVERSVHAAGPWEPIAPELQYESGVTVALDRTAEAGGEYSYRLVAQLTDGSQAVFGPVSAGRTELPARSDLSQVSPNPARGGFHMRYAVARAGPVRLELLDVSGRVVATLADRAQEPGRYEIAWDGAGRRGQLAAGLYLVRLMAPDRVTVRKLAVVR